MHKKFAAFFKQKYSQYSLRKISFQKIYKPASSKLLKHIKIIFSASEYFLYEALQLHLNGKTLVSSCLRFVCVQIFATVLKGIVK